MYVLPAAHIKAVPGHLYPVEVIAYVCVISGSSTE
jgi:hypothetical protein